MPKKHEYAFDVRLAVCIRVEATSRDKAEEMVLDAINGAEVNCGAWPNGDPIVVEAYNADDGPLELIEIDGEWVG